MKTDRQIEEIMLGMVREKAMEIYSEALIEHGVNPRNHGSIGSRRVREDNRPMRGYRRDVPPCAKRHD